MKLLTNKEVDKIYEDEFEVWNRKKLIIAGKVFEHSRQDGRGHSINFVFGENISLKTLLEATTLIHNKYGKKKRNKR